MTAIRYIVLILLVATYLWSAALRIKSAKFHKASFINEGLVCVATDKQKKEGTHRRGVLPGDADLGHI